MALVSNGLNVDRALSTIQRRWMPASVAFVLTTLAVFTLISKQKVVYQAEGKLRFERNSSTAQITGLMKELGELSPLGDKSNPITTEVEILKTSRVLEETIEKMDLKNSEGKPYSPMNFLDALVITEIRGTDIVKVAFKDSDRAKATSAVDSLMEVYLQHNVRSRRQQTVAARTFLEQQIPKTYKELKAADADVRQFKEKYQLASLEKEAIGTMEGKMSLERSITDARAQIAASAAQADAIQSRLGLSAGEALSMAAVAQSNSVQATLKEVQQLESMLAMESSKYNSDHPAIQTLQSKLAETRTLLDQRVDAVPGGARSSETGSVEFGASQQELTKTLIEAQTRQSSLQQQLNTLLATQSEQTDRLTRMPALEQQYRDLERRAQAAQLAYSQLLQKVNEVRMAENQNVGNAQIIASAEIPDALEKARNGLMAGGLIGLIAAALTIYLLEALDQSIKTVDRSRETFGYPLLGVIPHMGKDPGWFGKPSPPLKAPLIVQDDPRSATSAAFRMFQSNLVFAGSGQTLRSIVLTSSMPKEGKSTIAANLALSVSQLGKRVLLIDADLHAPYQHQIWDIAAQSGLTNILVGQAELREMATKVAPDLDVLPAGVLPPNPSALLGSQAMNSLLERAMRQYDLVILDTSPISIAADAAVLGKWSDGVVLVVRAGQVNVQQATFARTCLEQSGQHVLGQVVNDVIAKQEPHSAYYFMDLPQVSSDRHA